MKKNFLFWLLGLMSLVAFSSCDDKFEYDDENEFLPIGYLAKSPEGDEFITDTLQIMGIKGLIFDEIVKDDWKIITTQSYSLKGLEPLEIENKVIKLSPNEVKKVQDIITNYGNFPVAFSNMSVSYTYLGRTTLLDPIEDFRLSVRIVEKKRSENPFFQYGEIVYQLSIGYVPVKVHRHTFLIVDPAIVDE